MNFSGAEWPSFLVGQFTYIPENVLAALLNMSSMFVSILLRKISETNITPALCLSRKCHFCVCMKMAYLSMSVCVCAILPSRYYFDCVLVFFQMTDHPFNIVVYWGKVLLILLLWFMIPSLLLFPLIYN